MPPRKKAAAGPPPLTDADVTSLRARVQAGEKPRVVVRAASAGLPAGTRGNIVRIDDPAVGEYLVVRLGKDEVPFAPSELGLSGRATKVAATKAAPAKATPVKAPPAKKPVPKQAVAKQPVAAKAPAKTATAAPAKPAAGNRVAKATKSRRSLPPLVVTLRFSDDVWTVEASRGARRLAKAAPVRPGAVKAFADLVDEGVVRDALTETVESSRSVVESRAAALRAELQAAEAALKEYEARRR